VRALHGGEHRFATIFRHAALIKATMQHTLPAFSTAKTYYCLGLGTSTLRQFSANLDSTCERCYWQINETPAIAVAETIGARKSIIVRFQGRMRAYEGDPSAILTIASEPQLSLRATDQARLKEVTRSACGSAGTGYAAAVDGLASRTGSKSPPTM